MQSIELPLSYQTRPAGKAADEILIAHFSASWGSR
jgi:hypothetical protein